MSHHKKIIHNAVKQVGSLAELVRQINAKIDIINHSLSADMQIRHTYSSQINNWIKRDSGIAPVYVYALSQVIGCSCHDLRPDVFPLPANDAVIQPKQA